eukprot:1195082-Prorocentrum_minimum.AAC.7
MARRPAAEGRCKGCLLLRTCGTVRAAMRKTLCVCTTTGVLREGHAGNVAVSCAADTERAR